MLIRAAYALLFAMAALFALATRFAPRVVARLAFVPIRRRVAISLPSRAALVLMPPIDGGGKYRELPARALVLDALPGARRTQRSDQIVQFEPALSCVLAHRKQAPTQLVCVDVSVGVDELVLRARRFPGAELSFAALIIAGIGWSNGLRVWPFWLMVTSGAVAYALTWLRRADNLTLDAVVAEIEARVAVANGDHPPAPQTPQVSISTGSRFTGPDEWTCACEMVNARKRSSCKRCWSQRPAG